MPINDVNQNIRDGALGLVSTNADRTNVKAGVCSGGVAATLYGAYTDPQDVRNELGEGPLVEAMCYSLAQPGAGPVFGLKLNGSTAGAAGTVNRSGTGTSTMTITGAPYDSYQLIAEVTSAAANLAAGTAKIRYTLDGGDNYVNDVSIPVAGTVAIANTGISLVFADGTFAVGTTYSSTCTAPGFSSTDITNAVNVLLADPRDWGFIHIVGAAANAAGSATIAGTLDTLMTLAESRKKPVFAIIDGADDTDANMFSSFASFSSKRVGVGLGYLELTSPINGRVMKRNVAWPYTARLGSTPVHRHPGRVRDGGLAGVGNLLRDEQATQGGDAQRFITARTLYGYQGKFITNGKMMAPAGSDFADVMARRVMDKAQRLERIALLKWLNDDLQVASDTGFLTESQAVAIETDVVGQLNSGILANDEVSDIQWTVKRENNILSNKTIYTKMRLIPRGYANYIESENGFLNPALSLKTT